ncbi:hypothetical protein [Streptomyces sp. NPDC001054]
MTPEQLREELQTRLAVLPERITLAELAGATGRTVKYLRYYWVTLAPDFPASRTRDDGLVDLPRDGVAAWCAAHGLGILLDPEEITDQSSEWVTTSQISERLGLKDPSAVRYHARKHQSGPDPYPAADSDGRRFWPDVLAWHQRHKHAPRAAPGRPAARGLTPRLQQVADLQAAAAEAGEPLTRTELALALHITPDSAARLLRQLSERSESDT